MLDLNDYYYFVHVVEKGGFTRAANSLNIPKSRLSRHVAKLEERLNIKLIHRTSRQFKITEVGETFYRYAVGVIEGVEAAESALSQQKTSLGGSITLSCSVGLAQFALKPLLSQFMIDNQGISIRQQVTNESVDLIKSGIDIAVRGHTIPLPDSSYIQRHLALVTWKLYASPGYLESAGTPREPAQLFGHSSMKVGWQENKGVWSLTHNSGEQHTITHNPRLCCDDMNTLLHTAIDGMGIVSLPTYICKPAIKNSLLVPVLPDWHTGKAELSLIFPSRKSTSVLIKKLSNYLIENIKNEVQDVLSLK